MGKLINLLGAVLLLAACEGPPGPQGAPGPEGRPGPHGTGLATTTRCESIFIVDTATFLHVRLTYEVYEFVDGGNAVSCTVTDGSEESSRFAMYTAAENSTLCRTVFDLNNWSEGTWTFTLTDRGEAVVSYADLNDPYDGVNTKLDCSRL